MTRKSILLFAVVAFSSLAMAQSLADAAREARKNKRTSTANDRVYTNESLGRSTAVDTASSSAALDAALGVKPPAAEGDKDKDKKTGEASATPEEEKAKQVEDMRKKLGDAKADLAQLQRELDVMQRENRLRAAAYYGDAGNRLRNEKQYADDSRKYEADVAAKQAAITARQKQIDDLSEQLRRAGSK